MKFFQLLKQIYRFLAYTLINIIIIFIFFNIILGMAYYFKEYIQYSPRKQQPAYTNKKFFLEDGRPIQNGLRTYEQLEWFDFNACKEIGEQYASDVLDDFYNLIAQGLIYDPWVQYVNPPFFGKRVNIIIGERGRPRRKTLNPKRDNNLPTIRIFVFGGSTTFGYLVSDEHTWPTFLSQILNQRAKKQGKHFNIEVINYGRNAYTPSQETAHLIDLLRSGHKPSLAIFLEGLNWGESEEDVPGFTEEASKLFLSGQFYECIEVENIFLKYKWLPIIRFINSIKCRSNTFMDSLKESRDITKERQSKDSDKIVSFAFERFVQNKKLIELISTGYGFKTLFFLQPNVNYKYNLKLFRPELQKYFDKEEEEQHNVKILYERLCKDKQFIDLSNLFELWGTNKKALIDSVHYSPAFNKFLAEQIANHIDLNKLSIYPAIIDESSATGSIRRIITKDDID